jgi:hypothetical protein
VLSQEFRDFGFFASWGGVLTVLVRASDLYAIALGEKNHERKPVLIDFFV